ncbi:MAG: hotdog domain-containing protein [Betaproteobacteria bacterium]
MPDIPIDASYTAELTVGASDLASTLSAHPDDAFPSVFATSRMIALMEVASARLLKPYLGEGEMSVGVTVDISHTAATPPGARVSATARFTGREGKLFVFEVVAQDEAGEIGRGTHKRAAIATERLLSGARKRRSKN